jgi:putative hemolysin
MSLTLLLWIFLASLLFGLLFSTVSYALRTMSRVQLEQALVRRKRTRALDSILARRYDIALIASVLRLAANSAAMVSVAWYFLIDVTNPNPLKIFSWTILISVPAMAIFSIAIPQAWARYAGGPLLATMWPVLKVIHFTLLPVVRVLNIFDELVRRLSGVSIGDDPDTAAEALQQEILSVVAEGSAEGTVDEEQKQMIESVISFRDLQVGQIMTPRTDIIALDVNARLPEITAKILKDGLSRVPVFEGTLDNIVGILYAKDLLNLLNRTRSVSEGGSTAPSVASLPPASDTPVPSLDLRKLMRPPLFVPRTKPLRDLLREFRIQQVHMAIVLDEYGGTSGLVTTEDIIEEIVGDIADEYERPQAAELKHIADRIAEVDARMNISDLNRALDLALPENADYQTIGGFVVSTLGYIPPKGEHLDHDGLKITVLDSEPRRVKKIRLELPQPQTAAAQQPVGDVNI